MMGKLQVVVGGQFGSEGKGALAAWLARREPRFLMAVRVAGPNAGHTAYDYIGNEFKLQQFPVAAVIEKPAIIAIAAGSEIDAAILKREREQLMAAGHVQSPYVDAQATIIEEAHVVAERGEGPGAMALEHGQGGLTKRIGSTGKGVGAARAARIMREAKLWGGRHDVAEMIRGHLKEGGTVQIEGTQGYGLGLHAGFYPYCTSSDCRAIDFMAMAGVSPWAPYVDQVEVWIAFRSYPIRVAGDSGPLKGETTWEAIGQAPEYTTVTKKIRRVGEWDNELALKAIAANGGRVKIALMFGDYIEPGIAGKKLLVGRQHDWIGALENRLDHEILAVGTGPKTIAEVM